MQKCQSCGATYEPVQADGTDYFHACPPLSPHEVRALVDAGRSPLSQAQAERLAALDALLDDPKTGVTGVERGNAYLGGLSIARPNARDENVDPVKARALLKTDGAKSLADVDRDELAKAIGAGAIDLADAKG